MDQERREQLKRASLSFINSEQFFGYIEILYASIIQDRMMLLNIRDEYLLSMRDARTEMGCLWRVNSALTAGKVSVAPGLLVSGANGTEESEALSRTVCARLTSRDFGEANPASVESVVGMLAEEKVSLFRGRTLPLDLTGGLPVYLFDLFVSADCLLEQEGLLFPFVVCLVNPEGRVKVFPIPLFVQALAHNY